MACRATLCWRAGARVAGRCRRRDRASVAVIRRAGHRADRWRADHDDAPARALVVVGPSRLDQQIAATGTPVSKHDRADCGAHRRRAHAVPACPLTGRPLGRLRRHAQRSPRTAALGGGRHSVTQARRSHPTALVTRLDVALRRHGRHATAADRPARRPGVSDHPGRRNRRPPAAGRRDGRSPRAGRTRWPGSVTAARSAIRQRHHAGRVAGQARGRCGPATRRRAARGAHPILARGGPRPARIRAAPDGSAHRSRAGPGPGAGRGDRAGLVAGRRRVAAGASRDDTAGPRRRLRGVRRLPQPDRRVDRLPTELVQPAGGPPLVVVADGLATPIGSGPRSPARA